MIQHTWSKTLLSTYEHLEKICGSIDKIIMTHALNSAFVNSHNISYNNSYCVSNRIIELTERKITLINLKIIISSALKSIDSKLAKILILKHIDRLSSEQIIDLLHMPARSFFRKQNEAYTKFTKCLERNGYSQDQLFVMLKNEKWIIEAYKKNYASISKQDNIVYINNAQLKEITTSLKKIAIYQ